MGTWAGGRNFFAVPDGVPLLLCSFRYMLYEFGELLSFVLVELCGELLL